jgi:hypothetical protein
MTTDFFRKMNIAILYEALADWTTALKKKEKKVRNQKCRTTVYSAGK